MPNQHEKRRMIKDDNINVLKKKIEYEKEKGNKIVSKPEIRKEIGWAGKPYYIAVVENPNWRTKT